MAEQQKNKGGFSKPVETETTVGKSSLPSSAADSLKALEAAKGSVRVVHGAKDETFDAVVGRTIGEIRKSLKDSYNIPEDAQALIDGKQVDENTTVQANTTLEFIKQAGVKGTSK